MGLMWWRVSVVVGMGDWGWRCGSWAWVRWWCGSWRAWSRYGWCVVDGSLSQWLMGLTVIGLGWRFADGLFMGLARFRVWWVVGCAWVQRWTSARLCMVVGVNCGEIVQGGSVEVRAAVEIRGLLWVVVDQWVCWRSMGCCELWLSVDLLVVEWAWFLWERSEIIFILFLFYVILF